MLRRGHRYWVCWGDGQRNVAGAGGALHVCFKWVQPWCEPCAWGGPILYGHVIPTPRAVLVRRKEGPHPISTQNFWFLWFPSSRTIHVPPLGAQVAFPACGTQNMRGTSRSKLSEGVAVFTHICHAIIPSVVLRTIPPWGTLPIAWGGGYLQCGTWRQEGPRLPAED